MKKKTVRKAAYLKKPVAFLSEKTYYLLALLGGLAILILGANFILTSVNFASGQPCTSPILGIRMELPLNWTCKLSTENSTATEPVSVIVVDSPSFKVQIGNLGRFFGLKTQPGQTANHTVTSREIYRDLKMAIRAYYYDGYFSEAVGVPVTTYNLDYRMIASLKTSTSDLSAVQIEELITVVKAIRMY